MLHRMMPIVGTLGVVLVLSIVITIQPVYRASTVHDEIIAAVKAHGTYTSIDNSDFSTDTIDARVIKTDAIGADEIAANAIGASEMANGTIDAGAIATDAIGSDEIAADSIGASEIASNAIGSDELATSAVNEIAEKVGAPTGISPTAFSAGGTIVGSPAAGKARTGLVTLATGTTANTLSIAGTSVQDCPANTICTYAFHITFGQTVAFGATGSGHAIAIFWETTP